MILRLKEILRDRGISISSCSSMVGITQANMSNIVNGKSNPTVDTLERIAVALEIPITDLFNVENQELSGFVEYKGVIHTIKSVSDLEKLIEIAK